MDAIIRHIEYLASRHECVIIPGIGGVLASCAPARYDAEAQMFMPPSRVYSFNAELRMNDGLLAQSVARANTITYAAASRIVQTETEAMLCQLTTLGELPLGRLGVLRYADGAIEFAPFPTDRISVATSWLSPVPAVDVKAQARRVAGETDEPVRLRVSPWRRAARLAASVAVLAAIGFVASTPITAPQGMSYARMAPTVTAPVAEPELTAPTIRVPERAPIVMQKSTAAELWIDVPEAAPQPRMDGRYCVVVSSHISEAEARQFIAKHSASPMRVLEKDGRFRVYAASAPTLAEAENERAQLAQTFPQAWVCRR